jgi:hypothetical protein
MRKHLSGVIVAAGLACLWTVAAQAQPSAPTDASTEMAAAGTASPAVPEPDAAADWQLLGGLGLYWSGPGVLAAPRAGLERRLVGNLWLRAMVDASFDTATHESAFDEQAGVFDGSDSHQLSEVAGNLGLRYLLTPQWLVGISIFGGLRAGYGHMKDAYELSNGTGYTQTSNGWTVGGQLGLSVEREIVPDFGLRLSTALVHADYTRSHGTIEGDYVAGDSVDTEDRSLSGGLSFDPALELFFAF